MPKFAKVFASFYNCLEHLFYFILFYMCERHKAVDGTCLRFLKVFETAGLFATNVRKAGYLRYEAVNNIVISVQHMTAVC